MKRKERGKWWKKWEEYKEGEKEESKEKLEERGGKEYERYKKGEERSKRKRKRGVMEKEGGKIKGRTKWCWKSKNSIREVKIGKRGEMGKKNDGESVRKG